MIPLAFFIGLFFVFSLFSGRLRRTVLTPPIVFTAAGMLMFPFLPEAFRTGGNSTFVLRLAELGLVLLLFTDASRTDLNTLRAMRSLPTRLLTTGMLLTLLFGALAARLVFPQFSIWEAGILAAILAPTDAGLGQVIVTSQRVPLRIREGLNVEAGLNDGLSVPFFLFFIALAAGIEGRNPSLMRFVVEQLGYGAAIGAAVGLAGGFLLSHAIRRRWVDDSFRQIAVVSLPLFCFVFSEMAEASMFIAAFAAGIAVQVGFKEAGRHSVEFAEEWGQLLNLTVFFLFGMLVVRDWRLVGASPVLYAVLSLTLVRMLPVAIALIGTRLSRATVLFMGWFGPRGLASIVLGLVYLEQEIRLPAEPVIRITIMATVALSIFAHGLSAAPGINLYARSLDKFPPSAPEHEYEAAAVPGA